MFGAWEHEFRDAEQEACAEEEVARHGVECVVVVVGVGGKGVVGFREIGEVLREELLLLLVLVLLVLVFGVDEDEVIADVV